MRRVSPAPFTRIALLCAVALAASAQVNPAVTPSPTTSPSAWSQPAQPAAPPASPQRLPVPSEQPSAPISAPPSAFVSPLPSPPSPVPSESPSPGAAPASPPAPGEATPTPLPSPSPTQPPIIVDPPQIGVEPGKRTSARINSALGTVDVTVADPTIANAVVDQQQRVLFVDGLKLGTTTVTLTDQRGITRTVPVLVAYAAGTVGDATSIRVTGDPASPEFLREALTTAVTRAARVRPGASVNVPPETIPVRGALGLDNHMTVDVPVTIAGRGYFTVTGTTRVNVENDALPRINPGQLMVSDYPERLTADGVLFTAHLDTKTAQRFLYYHYNPGTEPARRIVLKARNASNAPATIQMIAGVAGPGPNEMEVGHLSTRRFLVREARNEGTIVTIGGGETMNIVDHPLPPQTIVNGILQLRLVNGDPIDLTLVAQHADAPLDQSPNQTQLLAGGAPHARGIYPVPTFYVERTYDVAGEDLEIPIGQLPLPNLREGLALAGDYGVEQSITVTLVNQTRTPRPVALYANPRGGKATGTFLIDGLLVQAHGLAAFSKFKIWQDTINPGTFRRLHVVTMPEGGSTYPLRLIFAPDDGSVPPFAPGSPIY